MPIGRIVVRVVFQFLHAFFEPRISVVVVVCDARTEHVDESKSFVPEALLHQLDQMFGLAAETARDKRSTYGQGQADRIDRFLDVSEWHTFRLHTFSARRRGLACGQTINLVVHRQIQQIDIPAHRVNKVIAADSESVTVTACDDYAEVVIRKLDAGRYRQRPAVKRMHAVSVNEPREVRRTSNTADGDNIVGLDLEFDKRLLERRQHTEIAATGAPVRINFPFKVREREFTGIGLHYCGHVSSSSLASGPPSGIVLRYKLFECRPVPPRLKPKSRAPARKASFCPPLAL